MLPETEPPTKEQAQAGPTPPPTPPCTYVADVQRGLHVNPQTTGVGAIPESVACLLVDPILLTGLPCLTSVGEEVPSPAVI